MKDKSLIIVLWFAMIGVVIVASLAVRLVING